MNKFGGNKKKICLFSGIDVGELHISMYFAKWIKYSDYGIRCGSFMDAAKNE